MSARSLSILAERLSAGQAWATGALSGTSADGIDVALLCFEPAAPGELGALRLLSFETCEFPGDLGPRVRAALDGRPLGPREIALLDRDLGRAFGAAARACAERAGVHIELLGSHGQTVWHHDGVEPSGAATLQLGDGDCAAEAARCTVVSDFRRRDIACGGGGAPIAALVEERMYPTLPRPAAVLNLGGIANLSLLPAPGGELVSFDIGPCGSLLDGLARRFLDAPLDRDGACASSGRPNAALVEFVLAHPFFALAPPKSTGRDSFGEAWVESVAGRASALGLLHDPRAPGDLFASAVEAVAQSVARALALLPRPRELVLAGGGARNAALTRALSRACDLRARDSSELGLDPKAREGVAFALLAACCILGLPVTSLCTAAKPGRVLGKISAWLGSEGL